MAGKACPPPRINGTDEHFEGVDAKAGAMGTNSLEVVAKRNYPGGAVPYALEGACDLVDTFAATTESVTHSMLVQPGMYLAMPAAAGKNVAVGKDGKSMTVVDKLGWTFRYTLTIVK